MGKISTIKERILYFAENQGITKVDFFKKTDLSVSNFKGENMNSALGSDKLVKISTVYNYLDMNWLITGEGDMIKSNGNNVDNSIVSMLKDEILDVLRENRILNNKIRELNENIKL